MILLLVPPRIMHLDRDIGTNQLTAPSGLAYIGAYLKKKGVDVRAIDAPAERLTLSQLVSRVKQVKPDVVGIGIHCSVQIHEARRAAAAIKETDKTIPVIVGGSHPTAIPEKTLLETDSFDIVVRGEGEITMADLCMRLQNHDAIHGTPGIAYRDRNGTVCLTPPRPFTPDLDTLPFPAFELFPLASYKPYFSSRKKTRELPVTTARGCPSKCFFCFQPMADSVRKRSVSNVIAELEYLVERFGLTQVLFTDDTFTLEPGRTREICEAIRQRNLHKKITWLCASRVDIISRDLLRTMRSAGCSCITYGVESGSQYILDKIRKNITLEQARDAVRWTREAGIIADVNFIIGLPFENEKTVRETQRFMLTLDPDYVNIALLAIFPGTQAETMARANVGGLRLLNSDWHKSGRIVGNMVDLQQLPRKRLEFLQTRAYLSFYLRPHKIMNLMRKVDLRTLCHYGLHQAKTLIKHRTSP